MILDANCEEKSTEGRGMGPVKRSDITRGGKMDVRREISSPVNRRVAISEKIQKQTMRLSWQADG